MHQLPANHRQSTQHHSCEHIVIDQRQRAIDVCDAHEVGRQKLNVAGNVDVHGHTEQRRLIGAGQKGIAVDDNAVYEVG